MIKLVKLKDDTYNRLIKLGQYGDTIDDLVKKLLDNKKLL
jgi:predicted CopG family antitoxin